MTAGVWYVGGPNLDDRAELRHSLRSVEQHAPIIDEAWVIGDVPAWFAGVKVPLPPLPDKFHNARQSIERFVNLPAAPAAFYLLNDDHFITEPVVGHLPVCRLNRCSTELNHWASENGGVLRNTFHRAVQDTAFWIGNDPWAYVAHTPLLINTAKAQEFLANYPNDRRLEPFLLYAVAGIGDEGTDCGNAKVANGDSLNEKLAQPMPYLSTNPDSWPAETGDWIRATFTKPSKWEH